MNPNCAVEPDGEAPEIRKYKKRFNGEILCAALWGVNLLIGKLVVYGVLTNYRNPNSGTDNGLMLLDRSGQGKGSLLINCICNVKYARLSLPFDHATSLWPNDRPRGPKHSGHDQRQKAAHPRLLSLLAEAENPAHRRGESRGKHQWLMALTSYIHYMDFVML